MTALTSPQLLARQYHIDEYNAKKGDLFVRKDVLVVASVQRLDFLEAHLTNSSGGRGLSKS